MIKMYDFKSQYQSIKDEIDQALQNVLDDSAFSSGKYVQKFENEFSNYIQTKHCVAVNNGTSALHAALLALDVKPNDEILVPSFSFFATCEAVSLTGATPVFVDSDYNDFNIDMSDLESKINNKTKAVICVHLYGQPCNMDQLKKITKKYNLYLIEDAAQAHGAEYINQKIGSFGDLSCFSFYPTKNLGSYGEGGAILTDDKVLFEKLMSIRNHGSSEQYKHHIIGHNYRMTGFQGAILSVKLKYLDKWNSIRISNANLYNKYLEGISEVEVPLIHSNSIHVFHQYTLKAKNRDTLKKYLLDNNIESAIYYPVPCHAQYPYSNKENINTVAEGLSEKVLSLPISEHITSDNIKYISDTIRKFYNQ